MTDKSTVERIVYARREPDGKGWFDFWLPMPMRWLTENQVAQQVRETLRDGDAQPPKRIVHLGTIELDLPQIGRGWALRQITCRARPATGAATAEVVAAMQAELIGVVVCVEYGMSWDTIGKMCLAPGNAVAISTMQQAYPLTGKIAVGVNVILPPEWEASRTWQIGILLEGAIIYDGRQ